jgi:NAD+ synthase (glutamine-hydrolysing)
MKVYNDAAIGLPNDLAEVLAEYREHRGFDAEDWVDRKLALINAYFRVHKLKGAVVGVSGGIDSAVALTLVHHAANLPQSPIGKIVPLLLPALSYEGATNQNETIQRGSELCEGLGLKPTVFTKLTEASNLVSDELSSVLGLPATEWTKGQLVAYQRTPILYNACSILTDAGYPALVIGTTNLSEGGYLGYVGKASDGMVDLQIVSDLYKSEIFQVARLLGVPKSILEVTPAGDMFDGRVDEEVFGATYDFVELYHHWLQHDKEAKAFAADPVFAAAAENLENLHRYNSHKYQYSSPSIHLDIMRADIPGGWSNKVWKDR